MVSGRADLVPGRTCVCGDSAAGGARGCGRRGDAWMDDGGGRGEHWGCEGGADVGAGRGRGVGVFGFGERGKGLGALALGLEFLGCRARLGCLGWLGGGVVYQLAVRCGNVIGLEESELFGIYIKRWVAAEGLK